MVRGRPEIPVLERDRTFRELVEPERADLEPGTLASYRRLQTRQPRLHVGIYQSLDDP